MEPFTGIHRAPEKLGRLGFGDHLKLSLQLGGLVLSATPSAKVQPKGAFGEKLPPPPGPGVVWRVAPSSVLPMADPKAASF